MLMSPNQVRVIDPVLTEIAQGYRHAEHVGQALFPKVPVQVSGGQVLEFGRESFKLYQVRRAPGAATRRIQFGFLGKSFALMQDSIEAQVPREYQRDASRAPGIDLAQRSISGALRALSLTLEYDQASLATNPDNYDNNHKLTLSGSDQWSDGGSNPSGDIDAAREAVRASVGIYPNTLVLSAKAFAALKSHPQVVDRFKYTSRDSVTPDMLAALWDLQTVAVGKAVAFNDAGQDIDIWGNHAILAYTPAHSSGIEDPSFGYTYTMEGHPLVERPYYENNAKSWIYPVTYERVPVLTGILSGFLIRNPA
ncbi:hypothetical protein SIID45300_00101 [Candidatus Magnetaquicoccaceae bacterium FCR-1]|uniref:Major capsid protein E n=1 Tax=Candidatus Magnetaquiglobus chichijimensis TaxID=3141448 RepID=A0ABQ0C4J0_9PROT